MPVVTGQLFGNYQVVRLLGQGGFGEVYEAENPLLERRAAIKVLHSGLVQDLGLVRRFLNEARAASGIHHPNIIEVFDAGVTPEGEPYILMEFLEGDSLHKILLEQGRLPLPVVQEIARQACSALSAAHAAGIVHRDLKPENLLLIPNPSSHLGFRVKVLDFGIAKFRHREGNDSTVRTRIGSVMGSPAYMSPEQCKDSSEVDHRTDIYSMGIIVYEMLAGVPPFASNSATEILVMQISAAPPALHVHCPDVPDYVEQAVSRALSKDREARYDSVDDFVAALLGSNLALTTPGFAPSAAGDVAQPSNEVSGSGPAAGRQPAAQPALAAPQRAGPDLVPAEKQNHTITTLANVSGEATSHPDDSRSTDEHVVVRPRHWPILAVGTAIALSILLVLVILSSKRSASLPISELKVESDPRSAKTGGPAAGATLVHLRIHSTPMGATVIDDKDGSILGQTPLEKTFPQGEGSLGLMLRLDGHKDRTVNIGLAEDSSTLVDFQGAEAEATNAPSSSTAGLRPRAPARKPAKPLQQKEDEWLAH